MGISSPEVKFVLTYSDLNISKVYFFYHIPYLLRRANVGSKKRLKIPKGFVKRRRTNNTMAKQTKTKGQTTSTKHYI